MGKDRLHFDYEGFVEIRESLMNIATTDSEMAETIRGAINDVIAQSRAEVSAAARGAMRFDPRESYRAVRRSVYRKIFGGQINIYTSRRNKDVPSGHGFPDRVAAGKRKRSPRTEAIDGYFGKDRGFILRFVNSGTVRRQTRYGSRGSIRARNWFGPSAGAAMQRAAQRLAQLIDEEITKALNNQ